MKNILIFDTETTGLFDKKLPLNHESQPYIVQLAALLTDENGNHVSNINFIIKPDNWSVPTGAAEVHSVPTEKADRFGVPIGTALRALLSLWEVADVVVGHNVSYDIQMIKRYYQDAHKTPFDDRDREIFDTMFAMNNVVKAPLTERQRAAKKKWPNLDIPDFKNPTLTESYKHAFNEEFDGAHNAMVDVEATSRVYQYCKDLEEGQMTIRKCTMKDR